MWHSLPPTVSCVELWVGYEQYLGKSRNHAISPRGGRLLVSRGATLFASVDGVTAFGSEAQARRDAVTMSAKIVYRPLLRRFGALPGSRWAFRRSLLCAWLVWGGRGSRRAASLGSAGASPSQRAMRRSVRGSVVSSAACPAPG